MNNSNPNTLQELFNDRKRWCKESFAKTESGGFASARSPDTVSWCLMGGIDKVYGSTYAASKIRAKIMHKVGVIGLWNDRVRRRFSDVVALVKELDI